MKIPTVAGTRIISGEPPRSTAYYYADLERLKRKNASGDPTSDEAEDRANPDELSEYVESNEVVNDGAVREVPPLRDRQWSLPEYSTPENRKPEETYSTAGTFPMPEPKEKEPLLAELEVVGRLPLTQLDSASGVRRSRSWYLCCPNIGDEEISRESSWRYSSLRPVTAPPLPGQNGIHTVTTQSSGRPEDITTLRAERDALARALSAERQRAATAARAHDARLAELHGVIAELVRRRAADKHARAIPEEEVSDECESTTQPAGDLDNDADRSRTEQNDTSSLLSPAELPTPQEKPELQELPDDTTDTSTQEIGIGQPRLEVSPAEPCDVSAVSERDSELCLSTARCCQQSRGASAGSCEREHGSADGRLCTAGTGTATGTATGRGGGRAKLAARVRLRRAAASDTGSGSGSGSGSGHNSTSAPRNDDAWCAEAAERLALDVCAQADLREALVAAANDGSALSASVCLWRARCARLEADCRVLHCALARATDTAHRLSCACAVQESSAVALCCALRAADRALEVYDVLLALQETSHGPSPEREAAELVARQLLGRLDAEQTSASIGEPLLSPGPWLQHDHQAGEEQQAWCAASEARLREHAARLKADTVALRTLRPPPHLFSYHDSEEEEGSKSVGAVNMAEMEAAVMMQEVLAAREARAAARAAGLQHADTSEHKGEWGRARRRARGGAHWLHAHAHAAETDL